MTRQDMVRYLRDLVAAHGHDGPTIRLIDEEADDSLTVEADGERFEIIVGSADGMGLKERDEAALAAFARSIDDAADDADRNGPVSHESLRRSLDEAKARGMERWSRRRHAHD